MDTCAPSSIAALTTAQRVAGQQVADRPTAPAAAAIEIVQIETALRVAEAQAGQSPSGPPAREMAVELRPDRARETLAR